MKFICIVMFTNNFFSPESNRIKSTDLNQTSFTIEFDYNNKNLSSISRRYQ